MQEAKKSWLVSSVFTPISQENNDSDWKFCLATITHFAALSGAHCADPLVPIWWPMDWGKRARTFLVIPDSACGGPAHSESYLTVTVVELHIQSYTWQWLWRTSTFRVIPDSDCGGPAHSKSYLTVTVADLHIPSRTWQWLWRTCTFQVVPESDCGGPAYSESYLTVTVADLHITELYLTVTVADQHIPSRTWQWLWRTSTFRVVPDSDCGGPAHSESYLTVTGRTCTYWVIPDSDWADLHILSHTWQWLWPSCVLPQLPLSSLPPWLARWPAVLPPPPCPPEKSSHMSVCITVFNANKKNKNFLWD